MTYLRRIFLLRHAKSEHSGANADLDRPLARRGHRACAALADHLRKEQLAPDLVLCSSARRTRQTVAGIAAALPPTVPVVTEDRLYLAEPSELLTRLRELDDGLPSVLLVGHNPGIHTLAVALLDPAQRDEMPTFPTAALAVLETRIHRWVDLGPGTTHLASFTTF
ncbi:MAG: SixA phosphatase family protein [Frankia sp.]